MTLLISNASGERTFSALKRVKYYFINTMTEDRLSSMSLLYIEREVLSKIDTTKKLIILRGKNLEKHLYNLINDKYIINYNNN